MAKSNSTSFSSRFIGAAVKPGQKVYSSSRPELIAASTKDKFLINDRAADMMRVKAGDKVYFIDMANMNADLPEDQKVAYDLNDRFFAAVNYQSAETGEIEGGILSKQRVFSYSRVWSAMHINQPDIVAARPEDMIRMGLAVSRGTGKKGCIATQKVAFEVVPFVDEEGEELHLIEENGNPTKLFKLVAATILPHDPNVDENLA